MGARIGGRVMHRRNGASASLALPLAMSLVMILTSPAFAQTPEEFFRQNCHSCHTIGGGRLVGPDLKNVHERKEREWLVDFVLDPKAMIDSGDPYAQQLLDEARGVVMPNVPGVSRARVEALLDMIAEESELEQSQFGGSQISDRPFTPEDVAMGRSIFLGTRRLENGGPPCAACHTVFELGGLGGGHLGPDLTKVYERIGSRPALAGWLQGPATTTMRPVFTGHPLTSEEILALVAFFEHTAKSPAEASAVPRLNFFLLGLLGAAFALALFDGIWRRRFRAVRRPLVDAN